MIVAVNVVSTQIYDHGPMTNPSPLSNDSIAPSNPERNHQSEERHHHPVHSLKQPAQFLAFWAAVTLPFVHLPLLSRGLGNPNVSLAFLVLLMINVLALYVGHGYNQK